MFCSLYREQLVHKLKLEAAGHEEKLERMKSKKMAELHVSGKQCKPSLPYYAVSSHSMTRSYLMVIRGVLKFNNNIIIVLDSTVCCCE